MTGKQQRGGQRQTDRHRESQREKEMARRHREMTQGKKGKTDREKQIRVGQGLGERKTRPWKGRREEVEGETEAGGRRDGYTDRDTRGWGWGGQTQEMGTE